MVQRKSRHSGIPREAISVRVNGSAYSVVLPCATLEARVGVVLVFACWCSVGTDPGVRNEPRGSLIPC